MKVGLIESFILANISFLISAVSLGCIKFCMEEGQAEELAVVIPILFWAGLIVGHVFNWQCNKMVKECEQKKNMADKEQKPLCLSFGTNKYAWMVDIMMFLFLVLLIAVILMKSEDETIVLMVLSQAYLFVNLHFVYNGRFLKYTNKRMGGEQGHGQE